MDIDKEKIISLRKERGWSQSRLATICGLGERTIQRIEKEGSCSLESAMALASVFELTPKDLQTQPIISSELRHTKAQRKNWSGILGVAVLLACAIMVINLTAKYPRWEMLSASIVGGLTLVFSSISYGIKRTLSCIAATLWIVNPPQRSNDFSIKIKQVNSLVEYVYITGVVSSLVCGITIVVHSNIDPDHTLDYLTFAIRPLVYAVLFAELWLRPLKHRIEYLLQLKMSAS